jgi:hypothetical protein
MELAAVGSTANHAGTIKRGVWRTKTRILTALSRTLSWGEVPASVAGGLGRHDHADLVAPLAIRRIRLVFEEHSAGPDAGVRCPRVNRRSEPTSSANRRATRRDDRNAESEHGQRTAN